MSAIPTNLRRQPNSSEHTFRDLLESAPDGVVILDASGAIQIVNRQTEALFGYPRQELLGSRVEVLVPGGLRARQPGRRARHPDRPRARPLGAGLELHGRRKDGTEFPLEISLSVLESEDGQLTIGIMRDISARKQAEKRLRATAAGQARSNAELERQRDEFVSSVSHDLRTPVASIKAAVGVVLANEPPNMPAALHRLLGNIELATDEIAELINDLVEMARLQAGRVELWRHQVDVADVIRRCVAMLGPLFDARAQQVQLQLPIEAVVESIDAERFGRVLRKLLEHVQQHSRSGGMVSVALARHPDAVCIRIADDGPGIADEDRERIFERSGSGLGLAIARGLTELHGGRLWVESQLGQGSTFHIRLPAGRDGAI